MQSRPSFFADSLILASMVLATVMVAPPASAHWKVCENGKRALWSTSTKAYYRPSGWAANYKTAVDAGATSISATDFNMPLSTNAASGIAFFKTDYGLTGWDGVNVLASAASSDNSKCYITDANNYFNTEYTDGYGAGKLKAVATHELTHSIGMKHVPQDNCTLRSIQQRTTPCRWDKLLINTPQPHDTPEINTYYN